MEKYQNALINESSLYLQQHATNPINWMPWGDEAFQKAQQENKLLLISIGYSSCHWCHVMERETFNDEEVAAIMNKHFVCIKVDREERPDIDQVYMTAVQLMTRQGGWPLNCFALADGRPIYGGTYFQKEQWIHILNSLVYLQANEPTKIETYAQELERGLRIVDNIAPKNKTAISTFDRIHSLVDNWRTQLDYEFGGNTKAPKFPLPTNIEFLLWYGQIFKDQTIIDYTKTTLHKMAFGGIFDQLGGGFSRYSVDRFWKIPHFEKMLYDNGQLLSVYAQAYTQTQELEYLRVIEHTVEWLNREMRAENGAFFASQDADSEGEEGKFYVWNKTEWETILGEDVTWFESLYNPNNIGFWEEDKWVLMRQETWESWIQKHPGISLEKIASAREKLLNYRTKRIKPVTDKKLLTAWNALLMVGLVECYKATSSEDYLELANKIGDWIQNQQLTSDKQILHTHQNGKSFTPGFLDDYASCIHAFIQLYQVTGESWMLERAKHWTQYVLAHFWGSTSNLFYFTSVDSNLLTRKLEINDSVIPSTNSTMAHNLLSLSLLCENFEWEEIAKNQFHAFEDGMENHGSAYSNWALLKLRLHRGIQLITVPNSPEWNFVQKLASPFTLIHYTHEQYATVCGNGVCSIPLLTKAELEAHLHQIALKKNA